MKETKIVCLGDSLTEGYGIMQSSGWVRLLSNDLNINMVNSGISGDTTGGMLARFHDMVVTYNPSHVIIMGGTNDLSFDISVELILSNIYAMMKQAIYHDIIPIIGLPTRFYYEDIVRNKKTLLSAAAFSKRIDIYREKLKQLAKEKSTATIDFSLDMGPPHFLGDGIHPNESGQKVMKDNAKTALKELLQND